MRAVKLTLLAVGLVLLIIWTGTAIEILFFYKPPIIDCSKVCFDFP